MTVRSRPSRVDSALVFLWLVSALCAPVGSAAAPPIGALSIAEAAELALSAQPQLGSLDAQARAARASAVAARQLPDPELKLGIADWPITSRDAGSFTRDSDTQVQVGIAQEFPRERKRLLRGELFERDSDLVGAERRLAERTIGREAALAWLTVWQYEATRKLIESSGQQATAQRDVVETALTTGAASQADYLAARQEVARLEDAQREAAQQVSRARALLGRWIGDAAARPIGAEDPAVRALPTLAAVMDAVAAHPALATATAQVAKAETNVSLADAAYQPDWRAEVGYGDRPNFSNMVSVQVGIDLPLFAAKRQDQSMLAALSAQEAAEASREDMQRELQADARAAWEDARNLRERLSGYEEKLLPQSVARIDAATAGWRAGRNQFRDVLDARRSALEMQVARIAVKTDLLKALESLAYFGAFMSSEQAEDGRHD